MADKKAVDPHLLSIQRKTATVRDKVRAVFLGYETGVLLWGTGGAGKSWTVEAEDRLTGAVSTSAQRSVHAGRY